jgi:hypothetical protein
MQQGSNSGEEAAAVLLLVKHTAGLRCWARPGDCNLPHLEVLAGTLAAGCRFIVRVDRCGVHLAVPRLSSLKLPLPLVAAPAAGPPLLIARWGAGWCCHASLGAEAYTVCHLLVRLLVVVVAGFGVCCGLQDCHLVDQAGKSC